MHLRTVPANNTKGELMNKATIERLTQLALAAQGKKTKRPLKEILASERSAGEKYIPPTRITRAGSTPPLEELPQSQ